MAGLPPPPAGPDGPRRAPDHGAPDDPGSPAYDPPAGPDEPRHGPPAGPDVPEAGSPAGPGVPEAGSPAGPWVPGHGPSAGYGAPGYGPPAGYGAPGYGPPAGYGAPAYGPPAGYGAAPVGYGLPAGPYRPLGALAVAAALLVGLMALLALFGVGAHLYRADLIDRSFHEGGVSSDDLTGSDDVVIAAALVFAVGVVATAAVFITWQFRHATNAEAFAGSPGSLGPGWAIGGWFIPCANWLLPAMQLFGASRASDPALPAYAAAGRGRGSPLVVVWAVSFALGSALVVAGTAGYPDENDATITSADEYVSDATSADRAVAAGYGLVAVAGVLGAVMVRSLSRRQTERAAVLGATGGWPPPPGAYPPRPGSYPPRPGSSPPPGAFPPPGSSPRRPGSSPPPGAFPPPGSSPPPGAFPPPPGSYPPRPGSSAPPSSSAPPDSFPPPGSYPPAREPRPGSPLPAPGSAEPQTPRAPGAPDGPGRWASPGQTD